MVKPIQKITFNYTLAVLIFLLPIVSFAQSSSYNISVGELKVLPGTWTGSLTYIDYSSNKPYTMPADLDIRYGSSERQLLISYIYPKEPKANSKSKFTLSKNGDQINKKPVVKKEKLEDGGLIITTEYSGKDNKKKAGIREIYVLGINEFVIRKEVRYEGSDEWLKRNEYSFKKK